MLNPISLSLFGGIALLLAGCSAPAPAPAPMDMDAAKAQVQAMEDAYATAYVARDPDAVLNYYADDVVSYSRGMEPIKGKAALRQHLVESMAKDTLGLTASYKVMELHGSGDNLTEIDSWAEKDTVGQDVEHGTYFSMFKKNGDKWECVRDISVSATAKK